MERQGPPRLFDSAQAERRGAFLINLLYLLTWGAILLGAGWLLLGYLLPVTLAAVTAAGLQRPLRWLTARTRAPRGFLSVLLAVGAVGALAAAVGGFGWLVLRWVTDLLGNRQTVGEISRSLTRAAEVLQGKTEEWLARLSPSLRETLTAAFGSLFRGGGPLGEWLGEAARGLLGFLTARLPRLLTDFLIWVMASVFFTVDYKGLAEFLHRQIPRHRRVMAADMKALCGETLGRMGKVYGLLMLITFGELTAGLWLLGVGHPAGVAAVIAVVDILPVLGVGTVLLPWAAVCFLVGTPGLGLGLLALYLVITLIRNLLEPRLVSGQTGLTPSVSLICLYLGWRLAGVAGLLLFPLGAELLIQLNRRGHLRLWRE